jgi:hypothetical protein
VGQGAVAQQHKHHEAELSRDCEQIGRPNLELSRQLAVQQFILWLGMLGSRGFAQQVRSNAALRGIAK